MTLHIVFLLAGFVLTSIWLPAILELGLYKQLHHFYYGLFLLVITTVTWINIVGLYFMLDDTVQHAIQLVNINYKSPLHKVYNWLYKYFPKSIQHILDKV